MCATASSTSGFNVHSLVVTIVGAIIFLVAFHAYVQNTRQAGVNRTAWLEPQARL